MENPFANAIARREQNQQRYAEDRGHPGNGGRYHDSGYHGSRYNDGGSNWSNNGRENDGGSNWSNKGSSKGAGKSNSLPMYVSFAREQLRDLRTREPGQSSKSLLDDSAQFFHICLDNVVDLDNLLKLEKVLPVFLKTGDCSWTNHRRCKELSEAISLDMDETEWQTMITGIRNFGKEHRVTGKAYYTKNAFERTPFMDQFDDGHPRREHGDHSQTRRRLIEEDDAKDREKGPAREDSIDKVATMMANMMKAMQTQSEAQNRVLNEVRTVKMPLPPHHAESPDTGGASGHDEMPAGAPGGFGGAPPATAAQMGMDFEFDNKKENERSASAASKSALTTPVNSPRTRKPEDVGSGRKDDKKKQVKHFNIAEQR